MSKKWNQEEIDKVVGLLKLGKRYDEIGEVIGRTGNSIRKKLASVGITYEKFKPKPKPGSECGDDEKYCSTCKDIKFKIEFNKNKSRKDGLNSICRECSIKRSKRYYNENREHHKTVIGERNKQTFKEQREKLFNYLKEHPCVDCGLTNPIVLEFDHKNSSEKEYNVSKMIGNFGWPKIVKEINKCDVRCANCHRLRTAKQFNWYQGLI